MAAASGNTLGGVAADLNGDGWPDLYVANDMTPNRLWINRRDGTFADEALFAGVALNWQGEAEASMGVDAGDFDGDGDDDLFMTHLTGETNTLYLNDGAGVFRDRTLAAGLDAPSWRQTAFGTLWFDYDNDGWLDLLAVNGAVRVIEEQAQAGDPLPLKQPNQLFRNLGDGTFRELTAEAGEDFAGLEVSRGAAFGDVDNDGDTDVLVTNNAGPARLLINQVGQRRSWLGLRLDPAGTRSSTGSRVAVFVASRPPLWRRSRTDGSYASANDPRVLVGLGDAASVARLRLVRPDGRRVEWRQLPTGAFVNVAAASGASGGGK